MAFLCSHWNRTPTTTRIFVWISVYFRLLFRECYQIPQFLKNIRMFNVNMDVFMNIPDCLSVFPRIPLLPDIRCNKIPPPEDLIHDDLQVVPLVVIDGDPDTAILGEQLPQQFQPRVDHREPLGMFEVVVVMLEGALRVVGGIDVDALDAPGVVRQQRLEGIEVVALDEEVPRRRVTVSHLRDGLEEPVRRTPTLLQIRLARQPVQRGHAGPTVPFL